MPNSCIVTGCTNRRRKGSGISFHRFPLSNRVLLRKWLVNVNRDSFKPGKHHMICSEHFLKENYVRGIHPRDDDYVIHHLLLPRAVPSVFPSHPPEKQRQTKKRRPPKSRFPRAKKAKKCSVDHQSSSNLYKAMKEHNYCRSSTLVEEKLKEAKHQLEAHKELSAVKQKVKQQGDKINVMIQLPQSNLPHVVYNASYQGEVLLTSMTIRDDTLAAELSDELKEQVSTSYQLLSVFVPLVIGMTEEHAVLNFHHFTNSTKKITYFFGTSTSDFTQVDSIEEGNNGLVTFRLGDDVMVYQVQDDVKCNDETKIGKDFDKVTGEVIKITNYPFSLDSGCELVGSQISFCKLLDGYRCELARVGGDVCTVTSTILSERYPATMKIVNMTGVFREMIPFLAETVPNKSFEAELLTRQHSTGIVYPCLVS